jgi:outer membrane protein OmpA-like peptidoglycan-associated protein
MSRRDSFVLVPWHAVERLSDHHHARSLLTTALEHPTAASELRHLAEQLTFRVGLSDAEVLEVLVDQVTSGNFVVVRRDSEQPSGRPPSMHAEAGEWRKSIPRLADLSRTEREYRPRSAGSPTWIELSVVGERGQSYAGSQIRIRDPEGNARSLVLDQRSVARLDDVPSAGTCWVELPQDATPKGIAQVPVGGLGDASGRLHPGGAPVGVRTAARHVLLVVQPKTACVRLVGMLFELNKAFLLPPALEGIRLLTHMYQALPNAEILVVGHTDRTGKKFRNDSLSLERAEAVIAYMTDDVDRWLAFYTKETDDSRRWGWSEDLAMLSALPRGSTPYYSGEHEEHSFLAAVRRFQSAKGLTVDGDPGPVTRRALVTDYMALDGTSLPVGAEARAHGCGEYFPVVPTEDEVEELQNRRVEVFFFVDGVDPPPSSDNSSAGSAEYPAWNEAVEQERTFTPSATGRGSLRIETDLEFEWIGESDAIVELRAVDGSYEAELPLAVAAIEWDGYAALEFSALPRGAFYSLVVRHSDGRRDVLFSDVPFHELARVGEDALVDPISGKPVQEG